MTKLDYRTQQGREQEVLAEIEISGGVHMLWANECPQRRAAVNRLEARGRIRPIPGGRGDLIRFEIVEQRKPRRSLFQWLDDLFARVA